MQVLDYGRSFVTFLSEGGRFQNNARLQVESRTTITDTRSGESTRPDLTPKQESEICGLDLGQILVLRQRLDEAWPGPEFEGM